MTEHFRSRRRPLDRFRSVKMKLSVIIVAAVAISASVSSVGYWAGVPVSVRPLIAAAIALLLVNVFSTGITSPLREMALAARLMVQGDYATRVTASSQDEVGELARAFNTMAADLAEVDRQRRELVANVSHELRTPISALQANLENLVDGVTAAEPEVFSQMLSQTERLGRLVAHLLDLSRLESGSSPLEIQPIRVTSLFEDVVSEAHMSSPAALLEARSEPVDLEIVGDPERLHQVLANLVENALRFTPRNEPVTLAATQYVDEIVLEVIDHGPGIPESERERVFDRFHRADRARDRTMGGAGLGLAIARWIVELHEGTIQAEAVSPTGCRMVIHLPQRHHLGAGGDQSI